MAQCLNRLAAFSTLFLFALPHSAHAVICKTIDENGVVSYTDTPSTECVNPVRLRGYSRYQPRQVDSTGDRDTESAEVFAGYSALRIVQPANNAILRSNQGKVPVQIGIEPLLQEGHRIQFLLDGEAVGSPLAATDAVLSGIERGTHQLSAQVLDEDGKNIGSAAAVSFTLQEETLQTDSPE